MGYFMNRHDGTFLKAAFLGIGLSEKAFWGHGLNLLIWVPKFHARSKFRSCYYSYIIIIPTGWME